MTALEACQLLPCPFCGGEVELKKSCVQGEEDWIEHLPKEGGNNCALQFDGFYIEGDVATAWNQRAPVASVAPGGTAYKAIGYFDRMCETLAIVPTDAFPEVQYIRALLTTLQAQPDVGVQGDASDAEFLWGLLDDIDTASDMAKGDDKAYRQIVERIQKRRFEISTSDGYAVTFKFKKPDTELLAALKRIKDFPRDDTSPELFYWNAVQTAADAILSHSKGEG